LRAAAAAAAASRETGRIGRARAYVEIDLGGPVSFGAYSYITDAFHLLGARTLFEDLRTEWLTPDLGRVASEDPDCIFYEAKMYSRFAGGDLERMLDRRGWRGLRAVRAGRCFLTPGPLDFIAHHGPSFIIETLPWLSQRLGSAEG
jgi:ABC-type Fe3+-hydroxamate transport system substrate-binding protein